MPTTLETSIREPVLVQAGTVEPDLTDIITENESVIAPDEIIEAKFYMRPLLSREPVIDGEPAEKIEPVDHEGNNIKYEWQEEDTAVEGEYMGWWGFVVGDGEEQQTPEFPILISDHGPGEGVETGAIVDGVSDHMPVTVDALKRDPRFGERRIQKIATLIQLRVLKSSVPADQETIAYELPLLDYFSKRVALELCTPGIDYWARQHRTATMQGPNEILSFPDMIQALEKLRDRLVCELEENWRELAFFVPEIKQRKAVPMPASSLEFYETPEENGTLRRRTEPLGFVTKNPNDTQKLVTGWRGNFDLFTLGFWPFP